MMSNNAQEIVKGTMLDVGIYLGGNFEVDDVSLRAQVASYPIGSGTGDGSEPNPDAKITGLTGRYRGSGGCIAIADRQNLVRGLARSGFGRPDVVEDLESGDRDRSEEIIIHDQSKDKLTSTRQSLARQSPHQ